MTSLVLGSIGKAAFGPIGGFIGALAGSSIDAAIGSQIAGYRSNPSRLSSLRVQSSHDGAPIPIIYGKMRIAGQIIWASKFKETKLKRQVGGKGGQKIKENQYSISFAIGLCEGPISGIGQVWINGEKSDISGFEYRIYKGTDDQERDPLLEAELGVENTPNYKGLAYIVFEDMPLAEFGDRIPQMAFEVFARPFSQTSSLEDIIESVCLIPGAGEFCYATTPIIRKIQKGKEIPLNLNQASQRVDLNVSLDNLRRDLPNVKNISLVATWFGDDLRAGNCEIKPRVDSHDKTTKPREWSVAGFDRANTPIVSLIDGKPAYGGSPDDASLIEAIAEIKSCGIGVCFNPFVMMDIAQNNNLPNPYGGNSQGAYPWRGRITCTPAIGEANSAQGTSAAEGQINAFYGNVDASHYSVTGTQINYSGPNEWSYSRFILHSAAICKAAGGVDTFLIGSELIGLTRVKNAAGQWVFVDKLISLAGEVNAILGANTKVSYGADWTEYGAFYEANSNNTYFPLDGLWASSNIDFIGIDYYAPLSDRGPYDLPLSAAQMALNIESGEGYDYFYASEAARIARTRTSIADLAYNEPWVYRQKDIRGFWQNQHFERVNGIRQTGPTAWQAKSKPIRFLEFGAPAIDRGANRPSVFPDTKSVENGIPPFSNGNRNDSEQRNALAAFIDYWKASNETSSIYNGSMIDATKTFIWAWDARPYPAFPNRIDTWADGENYHKGHWIMGRIGRVALADVFNDIHSRAGINVDAGEVIGEIDGYVIDQQMSVRDAIEPLMACIGIELRTTNLNLKYRSAPKPIADLVISKDDLIVDDENSEFTINRQVESHLANFYFQSFDSEHDYQTMSAVAFVNESASNDNNLQSKNYSCALVADSVIRSDIAKRLLSLGNNRISANIEVSDNLALLIEVGDRVQIDDGAVFVVDAISGDEKNGLTLVDAPNAGLHFENTAHESAGISPVFESAPFGYLLDLPVPFANESLLQPIAFSCAEPWHSDVEIRLNGETIATANKSTIIGKLLDDIEVSNVSQKLNRSLRIKLDFGELQTGAQSAAVLCNDQLVDIISWGNAHMIGPHIFELTQIVRGLNGVQIAPEMPAGAVVIALDDAGTAANLANDYWNSLQKFEFARPSATPDDENSYSTIFRGLAGLPWAPCHIKARRTSGGILFSYVSRAGGTNTSLEAVDQINLQFQLEILGEDNTPIRQVIVDGEEFLYENLQELQDFGTPQSQVTIKLAQFSPHRNLGHLGLWAKQTLLV